MINARINKTNQNFSISISENIKVLLTPYLIPKIYKYPIGTRFIIVSKQCVIKPLTKNMPEEVMLLCKSVEKYHNQSKYFDTRKNNPCCQQVKKLTHL